MVCTLLVGNHGVHNIELIHDFSLVSTRHFTIDALNTSSVLESFLLRGLLRNQVEHVGVVVDETAGL